MPRLTYSAQSRWSALFLVLLAGAAGCNPPNDGAPNDLSAPKPMREYLIAKGFKPDVKDPECFALEHVRLKDAAETLGFSLASLRLVPNLPFGGDHDIRTVVVRGRVFNVISDDGDATGSCPRFLNKSEALCSIGVSLTPDTIYRAPAPRPTDSSPRLQIKSVTLPENGQGQFQIAFEVWADGTQPLVLTECQFQASLSREGARLFRDILDFPSGSFEALTVWPGKPLALTAKAPGGATQFHWSGFAPGVYSLRVIIGGSPGMKGQLVDYMWLGGKPGNREVCSDTFEIRVGAN
jgi:hypothetical protein